MPREGIQYDVDDVWRQRVKDRLAELGRKPIWLANESGCPRSMVSELLSGARHNTTYLPELHEALGWPLRGPMLSKDDDELLAIAHSLSDEQKARLLERALTLQEESKKR